MHRVVERSLLDALKLPVRRPPESLCDGIFSVGLQLFKDVVPRSLDHADRAHSPNENEVSDGYRERVSIEVEVF